MRLCWQRLKVHQRRVEVRAGREGRGRQGRSLALPTGLGGRGDSGVAVGWPGGTSDPEQARWVRAQPVHQGSPGRLLYPPAELCAKEARVQAASPGTGVSSELELRLLPLVWETSRQPLGRACGRARVQRGKETASTSECGVWKGSGWQVSRSEETRQTRGDFYKLQENTELQDKCAGCKEVLKSIRGFSMIRIFHGCL